MVPVAEIRTVINPPPPLPGGDFIAVFPDNFSHLGGPGGVNQKFVFPFFIHPHSSQEGILL
jgi:hypothetical protein